MRASEPIFPQETMSKIVAISREATSFGHYLLHRRADFSVGLFGSDLF
jgi:hypothetical protein